MQKDILIRAVADYVSLTGNVFSKAAELIDASREEKQSAVEILPEVLDRMKTAGLIDASEESRASSQLNSHADTLHILANVIDVLQHKHAAAIKELEAKTASLSQGHSYDPQRGTKTASSGSNAKMLPSDQAILSLSPSLAAKYCGN